MHLQGGGLDQNFRASGEAKVSKLDHVGILRLKALFYASRQPFNG
jgi:hypothetical protein